MDDQQLNRQLAAELRATYLGPEERRAIVTDLARRSGTPGELLSWALQSPSIGGNRNAVLLATAGSLLLSVDDDTTGLVAHPPLTKSTVAVSSRLDPSEFWFDDLPEPELFDVRNAHQEFLGRTVGEVLHTHPFDLGADGARIALRSTARISATMSGLIGDSGMRSARYLLRLKNPSRDRLMANFEMALRGRRMLRAPIQPSLGPAGWFMTYAVGLDNRELVPPFLPNGRNSDGLFGSILRHVRPHDLVACLPVAVGHEPPDERVFPRTDAIVWNPGVCDLLIPIINSADNPSSGAPNRLRWLGRYLGDLASQPESAFREELWAVVADVQSRVTLHLESLLQAYNSQPQDWADSVAKSIANIQDVLVDLPVPNDMRTIVARYGRLLEVWPEIYANALELNTYRN